MGPKATECHHHLTSLSELLEWSPSQSGHAPKNLQKTPSASFGPDGLDAFNSPQSPRLLLCHSMNGDNEDRVYSGHADASAYTFYHWAQVDEFVYCSPNLVTIPPCGWVDAAHINGVPIYGSFMTVGPAGVSAWEELAASEDKVSAVVKGLVNISKHHGLDGWLMGVQNEMDYKQLHILRCILTYLTATMHVEVPDSRIIWYDSISRRGRVYPQNRLNDENETFFSLCDGIFLNPSWESSDLLPSRTLAGDRYRDVYVGVDMFGQSSLDGGGFGVDKPLAETRWLGLSSALVAPGWTHEALGRRRSALAEDVLWTRLSPLLGAHGPASLPLVTDFCKGRGQRLFEDGQVVRRSPWHRLSAQQLQPTYLQRGRPADLTLTDARGHPTELAFSLESPKTLSDQDAPKDPSVYGRAAEQRRIEALCRAGLPPRQEGWEVHHTERDGFSGGGSLAVTSRLGREGVFRLFACDLTIGPGLVELSVAYAVKAPSMVADTCAICLDIVESHRPGISRRLLEPAESLEVLPGLLTDCDRLLVSMPVETDTLGHGSPAIGGRGPRTGAWELRRYLLPLGGGNLTCRITSIGVYMATNGSLLLGKLSIEQNRARMNIIPTGL